MYLFWSRRLALDLYSSRYVVLELTSSTPFSLMSWSSTEGLHMEIKCNEFLLDVYFLIKAIQTSWGSHVLKIQTRSIILEENSHSL